MLWARVARPVRVSGSARLVRTSGLTAICSASAGHPAPLDALEGRRRPARARRPATAIRTTTRIASWSARSCPASVGRRRLSVTTMNSTFSADTSATADPLPQSDDSRVHPLHTERISRSRLHRIALGAAVAAALALTGCGATKDQGAGGVRQPAAAAPPASDLQNMVPNSPGGGYDTTARAAAKVMEDEKITGSIAGLQPARRRRHGRPAARRQREGQRQARHADGARRRRRRLHAEVQGHAERHHPDRQAHRGGRRASSCPRTRPTQTINDLVDGVEGRPARSSRSAAAPRPVAPTTCCPMQLAKAVGIDPKDVSYVVLRRRRRAAPGAARQQDRLRRLRLRRVPRPGRGRRRAGPRRDERQARRRASGRARPSRSRASTWCSPTGAASWRLPASRDEDKASAGSTRSRRCTSSRAWKEALEEQRLDRRLHDRRRVRHVPQGAGHAGWRRR